MAHIKKYYTSSENIEDIKKFLNKNNYNIKFNDIFLIFFQSLYDNKKIILNNDILNLFFGNNFKLPFFYNTMDNFKNFLNKHNIKFNTLNYRNIIYEQKYYKKFIKNDINIFLHNIYIKDNSCDIIDLFNTLTINNLDLLDYLNNIVWFLISKEDFKLLIESINVDKESNNVIKNYFIKIEKIVYDYKLTLI